jgi:hypothetical protein
VLVRDCDTCFYIEITWYLSSVTLLTAVVSTVRPLLGLHRNGSETCLFQIHRQCWEYYSPASYETVFLKRSENICSCVSCASPLTNTPLHPRAKMVEIIWRGQYVSWQKEEVCINAHNYTANCAVLPCLLAISEPLYYPRFLLFLCPRIFLGQKLLLVNKYY